MENLIIDVANRILEKLANGEPSAKNPYVTDTNTRGQMVSNSTFKFEDKPSKDKGRVSNWPVGGESCSTWNNAKVQIGEMR